jgi:hypothetical protein
MKRYHRVLSAKEMRILQKRYIGGLMELAKHKLFRERNSTESWNLFKMAFGEKPFFAIAEVPKLAYAALNNHVIQKFLRR